MLELRQKAVPLDAAKLPTSSASRPAENLFFFEPSKLFQAILSSSETTSKMRFGLGDFVDAPTETWESRAWLSSIRITSGRYARYPASPTATMSPRTNTRGAALAQEAAGRAGQPILPSDFVYFRCNNSDCCQSDSVPDAHLGQVTAVGHDRRSVRDHGGAVGVVVLAVRKLVVERELPATLRGRLGPAAHSKELFLVETDVSYVLESNVHPCVDKISLHYAYGTRPELKPTPLPNDIGSCRYFVRRICNMQMPSKNRHRPLLQSSPIRGQLEIETYGRDCLLQQLTGPARTLSLPFFCFIDGFGLYRNMYRTIMGYYVVNASLNNVERARRTNVTPLTLGPHGSNLADVVAAIGPGLSKFEEGTKVMINGQETTVFAFVFAFTGDISQQLKNSGLMSQRANFGCRGCHVTKADRGKLDYDIVAQGRYHYQLRAMRAHMDSQTSQAQRNTYSKSTGLLPETGVPLAQLTPALDLVLSRPNDPAHSEFGGLSELMHGLLMESILTVPATSEYCQLLRRFPFPPGWAHLQNPMRHLGSYRLAEHGRWSIIAPILLRLWLRDNHIRPLFASAAREVCPSHASRKIIANCSTGVCTHNCRDRAEAGDECGVLYDIRHDHHRLWVNGALKHAADVFQDQSWRSPATFSRHTRVPRLLPGRS